MLRLGCRGGLGKNQHKVQKRAHVQFCSRASNRRVSIRSRYSPQHGCGKHMQMKQLGQANDAQHKCMAQIRTTIFHQQLSHSLQNLIAFSKRSTANKMQTAAKRSINLTIGIVCHKSVHRSCQPLNLGVLHTVNEVIRRRSFRDTWGDPRFRVAEFADEDWRPIAKYTAIRKCVRFQITPYSCSFLRLCKKPPRGDHTATNDGVTPQFVR